MNESKTSPSSRGILNWIERVGNRLPDPVSLFVIGALSVVVLSQIADQLNWTVTKSVAPFKLPTSVAGPTSR